MPNLPSESFCGPPQRFQVIRLDMEAAMTETQMIVAVCMLWTLNGFALGMAAGIWYMVRQEEKNNG